MVETDSNRVTIRPAEAERRAGARLAAHVITSFVSARRAGQRQRSRPGLPSGPLNSPVFDHALAPPWRSSPSGRHRQRERSIVTTAA